MLKLMTIFAATLSVQAFATNGATIKVVCAIDDLAGHPTNAMDPTTFQVEPEKDVVVKTYNGVSYELAIYDVGYNEKTRYQINLAARDPKTKLILGSASVIFQKEIPEIIFQNGEPILFHCSGI